MIIIYNYVLWNKNIKLYEFNWLRFKIDFYSTLICLFNFDFNHY